MIDRCKLCDDSKKLCKSHIVPEFFNTNLHVYDVNAAGQKRSSRLKLTQDSTELLKNKNATGIYDKNILCADCEKFFNQNYENKVKKYLFNKGNSPYKLNGRIISDYYYLYDVEYIVIKLFLLSIFWRASVSLQMSEVNLGIDEDIIKNMLLNNNAMTPTDFPIQILYVNDYRFNFVSTVMQESLRTGGYRVSFVAGKLYYLMYDKIDSVPTIQRHFTLGVNNEYKLPMVYSKHEANLILNNIKP